MLETSELNVIRTCKLVESCEDNNKLESHEEKVHGERTAFQLMTYTQNEHWVSRVLDMELLVGK